MFFITFSVLWSFKCFFLPIYIMVIFSTVLYLIPSVKDISSYTKFKKVKNFDYLSGCDLFLLMITPILLLVLIGFSFILSIIFPCLLACSIGIFRLPKWRNQIPSYFIPLNGPHASHSIKKGHDHRFRTHLNFYSIGKQQRLGQPGLCSPTARGFSWIPPSRENGYRDYIEDIILICFASALFFVLIFFSLDYFEFLPSGLMPSPEKAVSKTLETKPEESSDFCDLFCNWSPKEPAPNSTKTLLEQKHNPARPKRRS